MAPRRVFGVSGLMNGMMGVVVRDSNTHWVGEPVPSLGDAVVCPLLLKKRNLNI